MQKFKVAVIGAHGGVGQFLSLMLKHNCSLISHLNLLDIVDSKGIALDLSHIPTKCVVKGFLVPDQVEEGLTGVDLLIFCLEHGEVARHTRASLFKGNAPAMESYINSIAKYCPSAMIAIITNPVNSFVPLAVEILAKHGIDGTKRVIGVTTLDVIRTISFVSELLGIDPSEVTSIVLGGHSGQTITPIITDGSFSHSEIEELDEKIKNAGLAVYQERNKRSATLGIAAAGLRITQSILSALGGAQNVVECAFVRSNVTRASYFASPVLFGPEGVDQILPLQTFTEQQQQMIDKALPFIEEQIQTGLDYVNNS